MKFSLQILRNLSLPQSFERGKDYYEDGLVSRLIKSGNEYTAEVWGSKRYKVWIDLEETVPKSTCNCPYDYPGPCKHIVAVCLAILDEDFDEVMVKPIQEERNFTISEHDFFEEYYYPAHQAQKEAFFLQLFKKNESLREQFVQYLKAGEDKPIRISIDGICKELIEKLEHLELEKGSEWGAYYDDESEDKLYKDIKETIEEVFSTTSRFFNQMLKKGRVDEGLRILLGIYEVIGQVKMENLHDAHVNEIFNYLFDKYYHALLEYLDKSVVSVKDASTMIYLIIERWDKYEQKTISSSPNHQKKFQYDFAPFKALWISLITDEATAQAARIRLEAYSLYNHELSDIYLHIAKHQKDDKLRNKILRDFALDDPNVGKMLLNDYIEKGNRTEALKLAGRMFEQWPEVAKELIEVINPKESEKLSVRLYGYLASSGKSVEYYQRLKEYASDEEAKAFVKSQQKNGIYYIQLLEFEQDFSEILTYIKDHKQEISNHQLETFLGPILKAFPSFCYELIRERVYQKKEARGRYEYREICNLLVLMKKIDTFQHETQQLIQQFYKQRLIALRDEMRKARLI